MSIQCGVGVKLLNGIFGTLKPNNFLNFVSRLIFYVPTESAVTCCMSYSSSWVIQSTIIKLIFINIKNKHENCLLISSMLVKSATSALL